MMSKPCVLFNRHMKNLTENLHHPLHPRCLDDGEFCGVSLFIAFVDTLAHKVRCRQNSVYCKLTSNRSVKQYIPPHKLVFIFRAIKITD